MPNINPILDILKEPWGIVILYFFIVLPIGLELIILYRNKLLWLPRGILHFSQRKTWEARDNLATKLITKHSWLTGGHILIGYLLFVMASKLLVVLPNIVGKRINSNARN